jgi:F-type H+-transporting ATPase subunit epsilon
MTIMQLEILTPEKKIYSGDVYGVQLPGITGLFEVLDRHAPLVSALKVGRVKVLKDKQQTLAVFNIHGGFVEVLNNKATVLAEGADVIEEEMHAYIAKAKGPHHKVRPFMFFLTPA